MLRGMMNPDNAPHPVTIVTGGSRGLGRALSVLLLQHGHRVLTLQRQPDPTLTAASAALEAWACDLSDPGPVAERLGAWVRALPREQVSALNLINNAASLSQLASLDEATPSDAQRDLRVGLEAPVLLSSAFLRASADLQVPRRLMHISSGLGRRAMAGSVIYCAVKAGLDHMSRALALEEAAKPHGARSVSIAPGVIDTDMQLQLRSADPQRFAAQPQFAALKAQGQLDTPEGCALKLLAYLERTDFGSQPVADIRDAA
jgi:benzil reductase ((S)-benzoin forming)